MDGNFDLPQYSLIRTERESKLNTTAHGGVLRAFHKDRKYTPFTLHTELQISSAAAALVKVHNKTISIACFSHPPDKSTFTYKIVDPLFFSNH